MRNSPILHIEDEDASAFLLQVALDKADVCNPVFRVSSGEDGLAFLNKLGPYKDAESPSLVLLDISMPRGDGWTVLSAMKRQKDLSTIPVIVVSGSRSTADRERALELGASKYVVKEFPVRAMCKGILDACSRFLSFRRANFETGRSYITRGSTIAFERANDNGVQVNVANVLPEGACFRLLSIEPSGSVANVRYGDSELWMFVDDLRDRAVKVYRPIRPDSPEVLSPLPAL